MNSTSTQPQQQQQYYAPYPQSTSTGNNQSYAGANMTQQEYGAEAPLKYSAVRFFFDKTVMRKELIAPDGTPINDGKIVLSFEAGDLTLDEHSTPEDFQISEPVLTLEQQQPLDAKKSHHFSHKGHPHHHNQYTKPKRRRHRRDLYKSSALKAFTTNWKGPLGIELLTVDALRGEGYHDGNKVVTQTWAPGVISETVARDYDIKTRPVSIGVVSFINTHGRESGPQQSATDLKKLGLPIQNSNLVMAPVDHPCFMCLNAMEPKENHVTRASPGLEPYGRALVDATLFNKYCDMVASETKSLVTLADITQDLRVAFFVPMKSGVRTNEHRNFLKTGKGMQWMNFADKYAALKLSQLESLAKDPSLGDAMLEELGNEEISVRGYLDMTYLKCNGKVIAMDTTLNGVKY